jgi:hypothetical protein
LVCFSALFSDSLACAEDDRKPTKSGQPRSRSVAKHVQASFWLLSIVIHIVSILNNGIHGATGRICNSATLPISGLYRIICNVKSEIKEVIPEVSI